MNKNEKFNLDGSVNLFRTANATEIPVDNIISFKNHPFSVNDDDKMEQLVESIKENGILTPVLLRPTDSNKYEMISGHRRLFAAKKAGLATIPAVIKSLSDDEAIIFMVDANIQREEILPSEKSKALCLKVEALQHKGLIENPDSASDIISVCGRQTLRYLRLQALIPELLQKVDSRELSINLASEIAVLQPTIQLQILDHIKENKKITDNMVSAIKALQSENKADFYGVSDILASTNRKPVKNKEKLHFTDKEIRKYFPKEYSDAEIKKTVISLLEKWSKQH